MDLKTCVDIHKSMCKHLHLPSRKLTHAVYWNRLHTIQKSKVWKLPWPLPLSAALKSRSQIAVRRKFPGIVHPHCTKRPRRTSSNCLLHYAQVDKNGTLTWDPGTCVLVCFTLLHQQFNPCFQLRPWLLLGSILASFVEHFKCFHSLIQSCSMYFLPRLHPLLPQQRGCLWRYQIKQAFEAHMPLSCNTTARAEGFRAVKVLTLGINVSGGKSSLCRHPWWIWHFLLVWKRLYTAGAVFNPFFDCMEDLCQPVGNKTVMLRNNVCITFTDLCFGCNDRRPEMQHLFSRPATNTLTKSFPKTCTATCYLEVVYVYAFAFQHQGTAIEGIQRGTGCQPPFQWWRTDNN